MQCYQYSGGNRRKLSAAIALVGTPEVLLLVCLFLDLIKVVCLVERADAEQFAYGLTSNRCASLRAYVI